MSKKYMYLFGAALLALTGVGASAQSVNARATHHARTNVTRNYKQYFVNAPQSISSRARSISGTASRGVRVMLQNGKQTVASTYANRKTGRYTLRIPKRFTVGTQLKVVAQKGYAHPYEIVLVKTPANQKAAVKATKQTGRKAARKSVKRPVKRQANNRTTKKTTKRAKKAAKRVAKKTAAKRNPKRAVKRNRKATNKKSSNRKAPANKVTVKTPNGNWQTRASKRGYVQKWNLSQKRGLNESVYHNGRFVKKLVTNAPYKVNVKNDVWTVTYRIHGQKKSQQMTMRFLTNDHFNVTNQNGRRANLNFLRA